MPAKMPKYAVGGWRHDGWTNVLTGHGTQQYDKRLGTYFCADPVDWRRALEIWRGDDLGKRIVELYPDEMVRKGFECCIHEDAKGNDEVTGGKDLSDKVKKKWRELDLIRKLHKVLCYQRAYGGGAWLMGINDGQTLDQPLDLKHVIAFDSITILEPRELYPIAYYNDPTQPKFGEAALYRLTPLVSGVSVTNGYAGSASQVVHESRLVIFDGDRVTRMPLRTDLGNWGDSVFTQVIRVLTDFNISWSAAGVLVSEFAAPVFKIEDLAKMMAENNKELFQARMQALAMSLSTVRAALIDTKEEYTRQQTPVGGLADLLDRFATRLSAAAGYPLSIFFGESPGGINASGASGDQLRMFYDRVLFKQEKDCVPALIKVTEPILALLGGIPDDWSIDPLPLYAETAKEKAETRKTQMETDIGYMDHGVLGASEVRAQRFEGAEPTLDTRVSSDPEPDDDETAAYKAERGAVGAPGAPVDPNAPVPLATGGSGVPDIQKQAMNGAQITSLLEVLTTMGSGQISRQSASAVLRLAFQLAASDADDILGPESFEPKAPPTPPSPFGGAPAPGAPKPPGAPAAPAKPAEPAAPEAPVKPAAPKADEARVDMLKEMAGEWYVFNEAGTKRLAGPMTEHAARERLREIDAAKAAKA